MQGRVKIVRSTKIPRLKRSKEVRFEFFHLLWFSSFHQYPTYPVRQVLLELLRSDGVSSCGKHAARISDAPGVVVRIIGRKA